MPIISTNWYTAPSAFENLFRDQAIFRPVDDLRITLPTAATIAQRYAMRRVVRGPSKYATFVKRMEEINAAAQAGS